MKLSDKDLEQWEKFIHETTNGAARQAAQGGPVTVNIFLNIDNSINIQAVHATAARPARLVDNRPRLAWNQPGNMEIMAEKIAANPNYKYLPLTKEELENIADFSGYPF